MNNKQLCLTVERERFELAAKGYVKLNPDEWTLLEGHDGESYWAFIGWQLAKAQHLADEGERAESADAACLPVVLELPDGDPRTARVVWQEVREGKRHLCIVVEDRVPATQRADSEGKGDKK